VVGQSFWIVFLVAVFYGGTAPDPVPVTLLFGVQTWLWFSYGVGPVVSTVRRGEGPVVELGARIGLGDVGIGLAIGVILQLAVIPALYWPLLKLVDVDPGKAAQELVDLINGPLDVVLMVVVVAIMAPLVEELFYRGLLLGALRQRLPDAAAIAVQAVVFAATHLQLVQFPALVIVGATFGFLRVRFGRLGPCWAAHFAFNAVSLAVLLGS
jgi:membrane protease YdiL (CAAX protease family)